MPTISELVVVACHSVYLGNIEISTEADENWTLSEFQHGEGGQFVAQAKAGVALTAVSPKRMLVLTGGHTRDAPSGWSEAESYQSLVQRECWWGSPGVATRCVVENFARDSFENLLYSICRFRDANDIYPRKIFMVSWGFKADRFDLHRRTLRIPDEMWEFCGVGRPANLEAALAGERRTLNAYMSDPYGLRSPLIDKRLARNVNGHRKEIATSCPELAGLLLHNSPASYRARLPWEP